MTDYYRDRSSFRGHDDDRSDDPAQRWRRNEERYRREAGGRDAGGSGDNRFDSDRHDTGRHRDAAYARSWRDDDLSARGVYGSANDEWRDNRSYGSSAYGGRSYVGRGNRGRDDGPQTHWHDRDREQRSGHPYSGTYGGNGDSSYFTGGQGSWAVADPRRTGARYGGSYSGGQSFGADYRSHGYAEHDDDQRRGFWDRASDEVASWFGDEDAARRRDEDHRGHGPKDYKRSDERIREDANDRLTEDSRVDASNVTVTVASGEITLDGAVTSREAKRRAEDVVDRISGVKHVQNNLRVQTQGAASGGWSGSPGSIAEGGTLGRSQTSAVKQTDKI
jgi:osmotically-inducible protein OsmY